MTQQVRITISTRVWARISQAAARAKVSRGKLIEQEMVRVLDDQDRFIEHNSEKKP